jgi:hypothetical protein
LDITYGIDDNGSAAKPYGDEVKEEYLDAYERYRENMRNAKARGAANTGGGGANPRRRTKLNFLYPMHRPSQIFFLRGYQ